MYSLKGEKICIKSDKIVVKYVKLYIYYILWSLLYILKAPENKENIFDSQNRFHIENMQCF